MSADGSDPAGAPEIPAASAPTAKIVIAAKDLKFGEILWVNIPERHHQGHEIYADTPRPWVAMSSRRLHDRNLGLFQAVPLTMGSNSTTFREARILIPPTEFTRDDDRLRDVEQLALTEQYRTLSEERIVGRAGMVSKKALNAIRVGIAYILALDAHFK